ncbi:GNAT family N-acetyltransferase [Halobacillus seohaensis]|uniref:GNAT family N-acetyltransferase n=1 Tax=Halobacillus seohaensis TaxID=447421 RepID=A0ABW2EK17_9BACI
MAQVRIAQFEDAEQIANIHIQSWKSTYKDLIDEQDLSNTTLENRVALWEAILRTPINGQIAYVIESNDGQIIGFVSGGKERTKNYSYDGEIYAIYLLNKHQRMGYGSMLLNTFSKAMKESGYQSLLVWILTHNPSVNFYEVLGAKPVEAEEVTIGQGTYEETAYGWGDINELIEKFN